MIACICGGVIETGVLLVIIALLRPVYRFLNWVCKRCGCKCKCHEDKK
jgi:hypothetical protein